MKKNIDPIEVLLKELRLKNILKSISDNSGFFYDEPGFYYYSSLLNPSIKYFKLLGFRVNTHYLVSGGISYVSRRLALLKCLGETVERFCQCCYNPKSIFFSSYKQLLEKSKNALDPVIYKNYPKIRNKKIGWIEGRDFINNAKILLPAQLAYLSYPRKNEISLSLNITTGAAAGFTHESALLNGIYEAIERDAFMTMYLNKIDAPKINLTKITDKAIQSVIKIYARYGFEVAVYNLTNDLGVPVFLTMLVDKLGNNPKFSIGMKVGLNINSSILGSLEEAFLARYYIKNELLQRKFPIYRMGKISIDSAFDRGLFWMNPAMLKELDFLTKQSPKQFNIKDLKLNQKEELEHVKQILRGKGLQVYYADITLKNFRKINYLVYKVFIPSLQPLYLVEEEKELKMDRLKTVAEHFGKKNVIINEIPHPFL
jgi:ribosomal protein S12 methylthiotransferase accessory factor